MKNILLLLILVSCSKTIENSQTNEEIAISVAEKKWEQVYGNSINKEKPFVATQKNDSIWIVHGTIPKPTIGGVAYAEVNVKTKEVIEYTHGK